MAEEFGVHGPGRDGRTVDGQVLAGLAEAVLVDDPRNYILSGTALTRDHHRQVGRRHGYRHLQRPVQARVVADDVKLVLQTL